MRLPSTPPRRAERRWSSPAGGRQAGGCSRTRSPARPEGGGTVDGDLLGEAFGHGDRMAELQRLSPPLWGLAEAARCQGDHDTALGHCERGYQASADVTDASYLYPYLLTGVRAHLARGDVDAAQTWSDQVGAVLTLRP